MVSDQVRQKPGCSATEDGLRLEISDLERRGIVLSSIYMYPYKNEKVAAMLRLGCGYLAAIRYVCDNWW